MATSLALLTTILFYTSSVSAQSAAAPTPTWLPPASPQGCFSGPGSLKFSNTATWQSSDACSKACYAAGHVVIGMTKGSDCYCGDEVPTGSLKVASTDCNHICNGYPGENCGSLTGDFTIMTTIKNLNAAAVADSGSSSTDPLATSSTSPSSTTVAPSVITVGGSTIVRTIGGVTATATAPSDSQAAQPSNTSSSTGSKVGVAVGVVVGIVGALALLGGLFLFLKKRRTSSSFEKHRRGTSVNAFGAAGSPPAHSINDSRLDQSMVERRNSDGSIFADNEDYSRRILKVTNPDGR